VYEYSQRHIKQNMTPGSGVGSILIVDDVEEDRVYLRAVLEKAGRMVIEAATAEEGLQLARQQKPCLIVMDIKLPGINGLEATRRLKSDPLTARTPVIVVTAHAGERRSAAGARYDALLEKPVRSEDLTETVDRLLQS
jgi:two-component system cell cycle response regulator DivK